MSKWWKAKNYLSDREFIWHYPYNTIQSIVKQRTEDRCLPMALYPVRAVVVNLQANLWRDVQRPIWYRTWCAMRTFTCLLKRRWWPPLIIWCTLLTAHVALKMTVPLHRASIIIFKFKYCICEGRAILSTSRCRNLSRDFGRFSYKHIEVKG